MSFFHTVWIPRMQFACRAVNGDIHSHEMLTIQLFRLQFEMILLRDCKILLSHPIIVLSFLTVIPVFFFQVLDKQAKPQLI